MASIVNTDILNQLEKILSSRQLSGSTVLTGFLNFIVRETLEGRGTVLKEYTIGVQALKKEPDFNPQIDGIVRIHAGRLRRALKEYYYEDGASDRLVISIPKGAYVPTFEIKEQVPERSDSRQAKERLANPKQKAEKEHSLDMLSLVSQHLNGTLQYRPSIAVLPFKKNGSGKIVENLVKGIGELLSTELTQFDSLKVFSYYSGDVSTHASVTHKFNGALAADYLLTGSVQYFNHLLRVNVQLTTREDGDQLWARVFETNEPEQDYWKFQEKVIDNTLASVTGLNGAISRHEITKKRFANQPGIHNLNYWYNQYVQKFDHDTIQNAKQIYEKIIQKQPQNALAIAFLSEIIAGENLLSQKKDIRNDRGLYYGHLAIKTDPHCQHAYQALAANMLLEHDREYIGILEQGLAVNPKSVDYRGAMGALLIYGGEFEQGIRMLDKVIQLNPFIPWWQLLTYSIYAYYRKFYQDALFWADRVEMNVIWIPIIRAASFAQLDNTDKAKSILDEITMYYPDAGFSEPDFLKKVFYSDALIHDINDGLEKAGYRNPS